MRHRNDMCGMNMRGMHMRGFSRAPVLGGPWRLRQLRQFDFGYQYNEEDNKWRVVVPLPGIDKESLKVRAKEDLVSISASVKAELRKYSVRPDDSWDIYLLSTVKPETANARYNEGILLIDFDLKEPPKNVDINYE